MIPHFIDGIELLEISFSRETSLGALILAAVIFFGTAAYFVFEAIDSFKNKKRGGVSSLALVAGFIFCFCLVLSSYCTKTPNYLVKIDDEVSLNEFNENYKIIEHVDDNYLIAIKDAS